MATTSRRKALATVSADGSTHAGLWFDAMLAALPEKKREGQGAERDEADAGIYREHLESLADRGVPSKYDDALKAREAVLRSWSGTVEGSITRVYEAKAEGRMIVGIGAASLTETNVALQRTWGVPFLPGSALKGLTSSTAHRSGDADWMRAETHTPGGEHARVLFGDTTTAGVVTFHDAWWVPTGATLPLNLDVMTVHHADYYMKGSVPADWDAPNPVAFVTAQGTYLVALSGPEEWVEIAFKWLELGLKRDGIGAKTHAGYGRMTMTPKLTPDEDLAKKATESLPGIAARYQGKSNRRQTVEDLLAARSRGANKQKLEETCRKLFAQNQDSWKDWLKDSSRTAEEKALFGGLNTPPPSADQQTPSASTESTAADELPWQTAQGWIVKNRHETLWVCLNGQRPLERKVKDVKFEGEIQAILAAATNESQAVAIEVQVKGGDKVKAVRAARTGG